MYRKEWWRRTSRRDVSSGYWRTGARPIPDTTYFIPAAGNLPPRLHWWSMRSGTGADAPWLFRPEHDRRYRHELKRLHHLLDRGFVLLEVRSLEMHLVGGHVLVDFEHCNACGVIIVCDCVEDEHSRLGPDCRLNMLPDGSIVGLQL